MIHIMSITLTFITSDISGNSCSFTDGTNTYTISNIAADQTSAYTPGAYVSWTYDGEVQNSSGVVLLSNQSCFVNFSSGAPSKNEYLLSYVNYDSSFGGINQIYSYVDTIKLLSASSGETSIPLMSVNSVDFNNNTITPNAITSPISWTFGPASSDYADISGNNSSSTKCTMTFYSSSNTNNIQNIAIAGTAAGVYELINQKGSQTLNSQYIASMALLWYSWYGIYE